MEDPPPGLRPADVVLTLGDAAHSKGIKGISGGDHSHATLWDGRRIIEATLPRAQKLSPEELEAKTEYMDAFRHRGVRTQRDRDSVVAAAESYVGTAYSKLDLIIACAIGTLTAWTQDKSPWLAWNTHHFAGRIRPFLSQLRTLYALFRSDKVTCVELVVRAHIKAGFPIKVKLDPGGSVDFALLRESVITLYELNEQAGKKLEPLEEAARSELDLASSLATDADLVAEIQRRVAEGGPRLHASELEAKVEDLMLLELDAGSEWTKTTWDAALITPHQLASSPSFETLGRLPREWGRLEPERIVFQPIWNRDNGPRELEIALGQRDYGRASELVDAFVAHLQASSEPYPEDAARAVLGPLRRKRQFALCNRAADALLGSGNGTFRIRQDYVQALIDRGLLDAARHVLEAFIADSSQAAQREPAEERRRQASDAHLLARGLLGRIHKQWYVDARAPKAAASVVALKRAISAYWDVYRDNPDYRERGWHGVNALALAVRSKVDGVAVGFDLDIEKVARDLVAFVEAAHADGAASTWDLAIAMEASLALRRTQDAVTWAKRYLARDVDAFEVASTLRQLVELWRLAPSESPGTELLNLLRAKLLDLEGGEVLLDAATDAADAPGLAALHRVFGSSFVPGDSYRLGLQRAQSVARIGSTDYKGYGTGVLVRGGDLYEPLGDERFLLTNSHVVTREPTRSRSGLRPEHAVATFLFGRDAQQQPTTVPIRKVVWESDWHVLDAALLRLGDLPEELEPCPLNVFPPTDWREAQRVFIAGYPNGESLQFSLFDNLVLERDDRFLHYRAAADKGSSGSPVFDQHWRVIGLHHAGSEQLVRLGRPGVHAANEGVLLSAIVEAIRRDGVMLD